jgi:hypothetical protein
VAILYYRDLAGGKWVPLVVPRDPLDEIEVSPTEPTDPDVKLWVNTSTRLPSRDDATMTDILTRIESLEHLIAEMRSAEGAP